MGNQQSSESAITNINNQLYVNKSTINQVNQQLNQVIANSVVKSAMDSGGDIINKQEMLFSDLKAQGDVDIGGISQKQVAAITFSAMNQTQARNDAAAQFIQNTLTDLQNNTSQNILTTMEGTADAKVTSGFLSSTPLSQTTSKAEAVNVSSVTAITDNVKNISNILQNSVENNFTTETLTTCILKLSNSQMFKVQDVESTTGTIRIQNITQDQAATAIAQCQSITDATNKIVNDTLNALDVKVDETNSVQSTTTQTGNASSTTTANGFFESLGQLFNLGSLLSYIVIGIIILIVVGVIIFIITRMGGKSSSGVTAPPVLKGGRIH
jgi:hypothetical protein